MKLIIIFEMNTMYLKKGGYELLLTACKLNRISIKK